MNILARTSISSKRSQKAFENNNPIILLKKNHLFSLNGWKHTRQVFVSPSNLMQEQANAQRETENPLTCAVGIHIYW